MSWLETHRVNKTVSSGQVWFSIILSIDSKAHKSSDSPNFRGKKWRWNIELWVKQRDVGHDLCQPGASVHLQSTYPPFLQHKPPMAKSLPSLTLMRWTLAWARTRMPTFLWGSMSSTGWCVRQRTLWRGNRGSYWFFHSLPGRYPPKCGVLPWTMLVSTNSDQRLRTTTDVWKRLNCQLMKRQSQTPARLIFCSHLTFEISCDGLPLRPSSQIWNKNSCFSKTIKIFSWRFSRN